MLAAGGYDCLTGRFDEKARSVAPMAARWSVVSPGIYLRFRSFEPEPIVLSLANMPFDLATITKQTRAVFDAHPGIELAVLFGSVATGQTHAGSDCDIAVLPRFGVDMTLLEELRLQHALSVVTGLEVDLVRLDRTTPVVKREVVRHGTPLLEHSPGAFSRYAADAMLEYLELLPLLEQGRMRYLARIAAGQK